MINDEAYELQGRAESVIHLLPANENTSYDLCKAGHVKIPLKGTSLSP